MSVILREGATPTGTTYCGAERSPNRASARTCQTYSVSNANAPGDVESVVAAVVCKKTGADSPPSSPVAPSVATRSSKTLCAALASQENVMRSSAAQYAAASAERFMGTLPAPCLAPARGARNAEAPSDSTISSALSENCGALRKCALTRVVPGRLP